MRGEFAILFSAILMGTISIFVRNTGSDPIFVAFIRLSFATVFLLPLLFLIREEFRITRLHFALAFFNLLTILSYLSAIQRIEAGTAALLLYTAPIYVLVISILHGERTERSTLLSLPLGLFGLYLMFSPYPELDLGLLFGIFSGISYSFVFWLTKRAKNYSSLHLTFFNVLFGSIVLFPYSLLNFSEFPLFWAVGLGLVPTAIPFTLFIYGVKRVKLQKAPMIALIEPVSAIFVGFLYFKEVLNSLQLIGGILVLLATALAWRK